jgi:Kdo2-lipid IVA lauroyltransferase/acyltransferase
MLSRILSLIFVGLLWLLHFLPSPILAVLGRVLGMMLYFLARRRRKIATINLAWCFPELDEARRARLTKANFQALGRSILDRGILWWGSKTRLLRLVRVVGEEKVRTLQQAGQPIILLVPHFFGLDAGAMAIAMRFDVVTIYAPQRNEVIERVFYKGRCRFGNQLMLTRQDGARTTIKAMKYGLPFYYLPDLNYHRRDSIFVPFFGIQTATITGLSRLSKAAGAAVVPCVTRMKPGGQGYLVEIGDPWMNFPTEDTEADTKRMNAWIESVIRTMPEQYFWLHRRFKTRPEGETRPY